jgi:hypothetical protein
MTDEHDNCDLHGYNLNPAGQNTIKKLGLWKFQSEHYKFYNLLTDQSINNSSS